MKRKSRGEKINKGRCCAMFGWTRYQFDQNITKGMPYVRAAAHKGEKLEWRTSIVDLMKALDIDSSLAARKDLARELGYSGDTNDSATMNVWLHKQVMSKLAANGGKLPPEIKH